MKGRCFKHWLDGNLPPQISDPMLILESVKRGDPQAVKAMVLGHMRLAFGLVARYRRRNSDDLVSAALYGVVKAVDQITRGNLTHDNPTAYIVTFVHGEIRRALSDKNVSVFQVSEERSAERKTDFLENIPGDYPDTTLDVMETIQKITKDKRDQKIVRLLLLGNKPTDIAREMGMGRTTIWERISRLRNAFQELENE